MYQVKISVSAVVTQWIVLLVTAQYVQPPPPPNTGLLNGIFNSLQLGIKSFFDQFVPNIQFPRPINTPDVQPNPIPGPPPQHNMFQPIRFPVCVRLRIFDPIETQYITDFPVEISFLESRPNGKLKSVQGVFRQVNQGSYLMAFNNGAYYIRFCPADASIVDTTPYEPPPTVIPGVAPGVPTEVPPTELHPPIEPENQNETRTTLNEALAQEPFDGSNYMVLSDTSSFPGCNNYAIFTTDPDYYYRNYDAQVMKLIARERADSNANPLHFLGCPCGLRE